MLKVIARRKKLITIVLLIYLQWVLYTESANLITVLITHPPLSFVATALIAAAAAGVSMSIVEIIYLSSGRLSPWHAWTHRFISHYIFTH